jgi:predicted nucleic acid-binding Zn ribbon protein
MSDGQQPVVVFDMTDKRAAALYEELAAAAKEDVRRRMPLHEDVPEDSYTCNACTAADTWALGAADTALHAFLSLDSEALVAPLRQLFESVPALVRGAGFLAGFVRVALGVQVGLDPADEWRGVAAPGDRPPKDMQTALPLAFLEGYMTRDNDAMAHSGVMAMAQGEATLSDFLGLLMGHCAVHARDALVVRNGGVPARPVKVTRARPR